MEQLAGRPYWELTFTESGALTSPDPDTLVGQVQAQGVRDLVVISHGWGTSEGSARDLYRALLPMVVDAASAVPQIGPVGLAGVLWPSLWFPDSPAPAGAALPAGHAQAEATVAALPSGDAELTGSQIAATLRAGFDGEAAGVIETLGVMIDEGVAAAAAGTEDAAAQRERIATFHTLLSSLAPTGDVGGFEDSGESAVLFSEDPATDYAHLAGVFGATEDEVGAQSLFDGLAKMWSGAKDALRVFSYYTMKARAGVVGQSGLAPLLVTLASRAPGVRVHLVGHSFGARLVSFSLAGIPTPAASPVASLTLVQAAFSQWAFAGAQDNPFGVAGALHGFADRVHGPLVATTSEFDWAVGRWYPRASALALQDASAAATLSRWGGIGAGGFQAVNPLEPRDMLDDAAGYHFAPGTFYDVNSSAVISDWRQSMFAGAHSDIRRPQVAELIVAAAGAGHL